MRRRRKDKLVSAICDEFAPRFLPSAQLVYVGPNGHVDQKLLSLMGGQVSDFTNMPDVVLYHAEKEWLVLADSISSHGIIDANRLNDLSTLFGASNAGLVFLSAFPDRQSFNLCAESFAWETAAWIASEPAHLIHFNGARFLGPYPHPEIP